MMHENDATNAQSDCAIVITRVFNAPRDLVFKVWTMPEHIVQWWGPKGFTTKVSEMDFRPGGKWRFVMIGADGTEYPAKGIFREIVPLERIVTSDEFDEGFEKVINADLPQGIVTTTEFEDFGDKTRITLQIMHPTVRDRQKHEDMGVIGGWNSSFDCLEEYLAQVTNGLRKNTN
jgi:uncharacterized protein YndB with AHSA1/START domain